MKYDRDDLRNRADIAIAHGALTNSKHPRTFVDGVYPTHLESGQGCKVTDPWGKSYFDFIGANGTALFGHNNVQIAHAVAEGFRKGALLSVGSRIEVEAAEKLKEMVPFADRVRFLKTGSEACLAAIRIARAATGRDQIASSGYHGWGDIFTTLTPPAHGCSDLHQVEKFSGKVTKDHAAVIVEPVILEATPERKAWLQDLRKACDRTGTILIFDEIITGFRVPKFSVARHWGIYPDIILLGKAMGGGMPLAAVAGRRDVMDADYFVSSTFAGDMVALNAFLAVTKLLHSPSYRVSDLWESGARWLKKFNQMDPLVQLQGYPTRSAFRGDPVVIAKFWQAACEAGYLFGPSWFYSFPHLELNNSLEVMEDLLWTCRTQNLRGAIPATSFSSRAR